MPKILQNKTVVTIAIAILGLIIILGTWYLVSPPSQSYASVSVTRMDITEGINSSGKVKAGEEVSLSFNQGGQIAFVNGAVGDQVFEGQTIVSLLNDDLKAQLAQAEAALEKEQIKLQKLGGESTSADASLSDIQTSLENSRKNLLDKIADGYTKADSILGTYVDQLFNNPTTERPVFGVNIAQEGTTYFISTNNYSLQSKIENERFDVGALISNWNNEENNLASDDNEIINAAGMAEKTLEAMQNFLADLAAAVNQNIGTDSQSKAIYDKYKSDITTARTITDATLSALRSAEQTFLASQSTVSPFEIELEKASVKSAQGQVDNIKAQIRKSMIISPIDGIITNLDAKVGEIAPAGTPIVGVISNGQFEVETYISEADIAKINIGENASTTLDAYGTGIVWKTAVTSIDPAETIANGIGTYKVTLEFAENDPRIRSGMTANLTLITGEKNQTIAVPAKAIITKGADKYVLALTSDKKNFEERKVTVGLVGLNGYTEILSGINEGDVIATFGK